MNLFGKRPQLTDARAAGELLALRCALSVLLESVGADFPAIGSGLTHLRKAALDAANEEKLQAATIEGFDEFMRSFIAAAKRHS